MPRQHNNWNDLIREIKINTNLASENISTLAFRHALFLDEEKKEEEDAVVELVEEDIPELLHIINHLNRSVRYLPFGWNVKSFHSTERTKVVHNHLALACLSPPCRPHHVDTSLAQLQHYRRDCPKIVRKDCSKYAEKVRDTAVWSIKAEFSTLRLDPSNCWRQLSYPIKNQRGASKIPPYGVYFTFQSN